MTITKSQGWIISLASLLALLGFSWPFSFPATAAGAELGSGFVAIVSLFALTVLVLWVLDRGFVGPKQLAVLGALAAIASATRIATAGVAGFELVFLFVILGGFAFGPKFGFLLGALTIITSSVFYGGIGPWTPFQIFAVGWVGLGAGLVGKLRFSPRVRIVILAGYAVISSYLFGLVMNLWFWPFATGFDASIGYRAEAPLVENMASFLLYTLTTSTLSWDSVRAVSLAIAILVLAKPVLAVLARTKL